MKTSLQSIIEIESTLFYAYKDIMIYLSTSLKYEP